MWIEVCKWKSETVSDRRWQKGEAPGSNVCRVSRIVARGRESRAIPPTVTQVKRMQEKERRNKNPVGGNLT
jgi:hypothetical protein